MLNNESGNLYGLNFVMKIICCKCKPNVNMGMNMNMSIVAHLVQPLNVRRIQYMRNIT